MQPPKTKRIALISEHASPLAMLGGVDSGGQNVYVSQLARHLPTHGFTVDVFTRRDNPELPEIVEWLDNVRIIHVPAGPPRFVPKEELLDYMPAFTRTVLEYGRRHRYALLHANFWMSGLVAADVKRELGIPFVITFHALGRVRRLHQGEADGFPDGRFAIEERIVREADRIIAECPQEEEDLIQLYHAHPDAISLIPGGYDPMEFAPVDKTLARVALGLPVNERLILQLGRMVRRKGVANVIRSLGHLHRDHNIPARLIVVGGESETPDPEITPEIGRLQRIAEEAGVADRVTFVGRRSRETLKYYYGAADIFVTTPWYEPFGITPLEAMACATPVIGANVGGIRYTVCDGETGYLVPPRDPLALAERLAHLCQRPHLLEQFGRQGVKRADEFTWAQIVAQVAGLYGEIGFGQRPSPEITAALATIEHGFNGSIRVLQQAQNRLPAQIAHAAGRMVACLQRGGKLLICGNGGSAAEAQHMAAELVGRFKLHGRRALPALALTADTAVLTAWANDSGYDHVFARQVEALGRPEDLLIGISTSGRSPNLVAAFQAAQQIGLDSVALLGGDGGAVAELAGTAVIVPSTDPQRIQEAQTLVLHLLCELVETQWQARQEEAPLVLPEHRLGTRRNGNGVGARNGRYPALNPSPSVAPLNGGQA
jgi:D-inositol-3-phosphate glycosyltransferase